MNTQAKSEYADGDCPDHIWNQPEIPQRGWTVVDVLDARDISADPTIGITCEMCGHERIMLIYLMSHPKYDGFLSVGRVCASKMVRPYADELDEPAD